MRSFIAIMLLVAGLPSLAPADSYSGRQPDETWVYKHASGRDLGMFVFLPEGYAAGKGPVPVFVAAHGGKTPAGLPDVQFVLPSELSNEPES